MNYYDDELPDEAFTDDERAAGVPDILSSSAGQRYRQVEELTEVTEDDCIALIVRSLVMRDLWLTIERFNGLSCDDYDFASLAGFTLDCVDQQDFLIAVQGYRIPVQALMNALRKIRIPLFFKGMNPPWLAWDEASKSLETNLLYTDYYKKRCFFSTGMDAQVTEPVDLERAHVFKLLRSAYLSSDIANKPILTRNRHLADALAKMPVPFEFPSIISETEMDDFSLVYYTHTGEVTSLPLAKAFNEKVTISTRSASFFYSSPYICSLYPSLNKNVLWANSFRMSVENNPAKFHYYLRRNSGTVFQDVFERIDLPDGMPFWDVKPDAVLKKALKISQWSDERDIKIYITVGGHPLQSNDCELVTTPELYALAVLKLQECGFEIGNDSTGEGVDIIWTSANCLARFSKGPYSQPWMPVGR